MPRTRYAHNLLERSVTTTWVDGAPPKWFELHFGLEPRTMYDAVNRSKIKIWWSCNRRTWVTIIYSLPGTYKNKTREKRTKYVPLASSGRAILSKCMMVQVRWLRYQHFEGTRVYGSAPLTVVPDMMTSCLTILNTLSTRNKSVWWLPCLIPICMSINMI